jgi:GNAT superfamily N-acetyltransferase
MTPPSLRFTDLTAAPPGTLANLLRQAYAYLLRSDPSRWEPQRASWETFDHEACVNPAVRRCVFLSWHRSTLVGLGSFDPRGAPQAGQVGHHCILPEHQGRGFGRLQLDEIERRLATEGCTRIHVSTLDLTFFAPAQRLYLSTGFRLVGQSPWEARPTVARLLFEKDAATPPMPPAIAP